MFRVCPFWRFSEGKGGFLFGGGRRVKEAEEVSIGGGRSDSDKGREADLEAGFERRGPSAGGGC